MKNLFFILFISFSACTKNLSYTAVGKSAVDTELDEETYPANGDYIVQVRDQGDTEWKTLFTHNAVTKKYSNGQLGNCGFVSFDSDFSKPVEIQVTKTSGSIGSVRIRPSFTNITYTQSGNQIQFTLQNAQKISVEFNGDIMNNLFVFANPPEQNKPNPGDPDVIYFGPGIHNAGEIIVTAGQTVYLAEGALVYGYLWSSDADNVTIRGRGILDGSKLNHDVNQHRVWLVGLTNGSHITIDGIVMRDAPMWTTVLRNTDSVNITNIKHLCYNENSDGLDIIQSHHVTIDDVFLRNHDDNISLKIHDTTATSNITLKNSVLWADRAHNMLVGPESSGGTFEHIQFNNIDVLENAQNDEVFPGVMAVMAADGGEFRQIEWKNIRIEDITAGKIICIQYTDAYAQQGFGNSVADVSFTNVTYTGSNASPSRIFGKDVSRTVDTVRFKNFVVNGVLANDEASANLQVNSFVHNLSFVP